MAKTVISDMVKVARLECLSFCVGKLIVLPVCDFCAVCTSLEVFTVLADCPVCLILVIICPDAVYFFDVQTILAVITGNQIVFGQGSAQIVSIGMNSKCDGVVFCLYFYLDGGASGEEEVDDSVLLEEESSVFPQLTENNREMAQMPATNIHLFCFFIFIILLSFCVRVRLEKRHDFLLFHDSIVEMGCQVFFVNRITGILQKFPMETELTLPTRCGIIR